MAEETKNPGKDIPIGLVGSMTITTAFYCILAVVLCLMQPYKQIDPDAPFSVAFEVMQHLSLSLSLSYSVTRN